MKAGYAKFMVEECLYPEELALSWWGREVHESHGHRSLIPGRTSAHRSAVYEQSGAMVYASGIPGGLTYPHGPSQPTGLQPAPPRAYPPHTSSRRDCADCVWRAPCE